MRQDDRRKSARFASVIVVPPPAVAVESLAQLKTAPLANPFNILNEAIELASRTFAGKKICIAFTTAALESTSTAGRVNKPGDPVDKVTPVKQSSACNLPGVTHDKLTVSNYVKGAPFYSFDTNVTMFEKVLGILSKFHKVCLSAHHVFLDDCPNYSLLPVMKKVFDKNFKR
ncbi:uncharacterized protein LOC144119921 [Amblyomma americanum]